MSMKGRRISGKDFYITVMDSIMIYVESATVSITDNRTVAKTRGVPDGHVDGDVEATVELELDSFNFDIFSQAAAAAGGWRDIEPFDVLFYAEGDGVKKSVEAFGCLPNITDLLNIDPNGKEKNKHKLECPVTSKDFIRIDGIPYLSPQDTDF